MNGQSKLTTGFRALDDTKEGLPKEQKRKASE